MKKDLAEFINLAFLLNFRFVGEKYSPFGVISGENSKGHVAIGDMALEKFWM